MGSLAIASEVSIWLSSPSKTWLFIIRNTCSIVQRPVPTHDSQGVFDAFDGVGREEKPHDRLDARGWIDLLDPDRMQLDRGRLAFVHKAQLASDRASCRSALANRVRLVLHTAAQWLMLAFRNAIPKARELAKAGFATLRLKLLKIAARVIEMASRVRLAFAAAYPEAELCVGLPAALMPLGP